MVLFGRRLFWVFVAGTGFVCGTLLAAHGLDRPPDGVLLAVALVAGIVGALIAVFAQKLAIGLAGLLAGGFLGHALSVGFHWNVAPWLPVVVGGVVGAVVLTVLFDWALIALSALMGSAVIVQHLPLAPPWPTLLFVGLLAVGMAFQTRQLRGRAPPTKDAGGRASKAA